MRIKTYRARSMQEALALVRRELGPEAAVLHTREVRGSGLLGLFGAHRRIEITASAEVVVPSRLPAVEKVAPRETAPPPSPRPAPPAMSQSAADRVEGQLGELQSMVENLCRRTRVSGVHDLPESLFRLYTDLIDAEMSDDLARELVESVRDGVRGTDLDDPIMLKARAASVVEQQIAVTGPIRVERSRQRLVALVGPTGVGKTTTIAKLAANYRLREKHKVGLITVDTYRIAAVEQLRTYADIIDLPMQVVSTPREMREAVASMASLDLVLIDTAGRSPKDDVKIQELRAFLTEAGAHEVHLVLSAVSGASALQHTAKRFAAVGSTSLILTKLDEATGFGHLLPLLRESRLPLSYLTNGQNVPNDIAAAEARRLAGLVVGMEADLTV